MSRQRHATDYKGVFYREVPRVGGPGTERMYYAVFTKAGKVIEAKCGRQYADAMTAAKANAMRGQYVSGAKLLPKEKRERAKAEKQTEATRPTFRRLWEEYKADHPGLKGLVTDENRFKKHIEPDLGEKTPEDLAPLDVDRVRLQLLKGHAPATVRNALELVRRLVNYGVRKQRTPGLSFKIGSKKSGAGVSMPEVHNEKTEDLSPEQLRALLEAMEQAENVQAATLMRLALFTGMRRGELFKLTWEDVDFERGFILIRDPKGKKPQKIPMNEDVRQILKKHPRPYPDSPFVFPGRSGAQRVDIIKQVNAIKEAAGLPKDFRALHGLRHAYASMLASSGQVDLYTLQKLLTHKSPTMTQRYAHLRDETLQKAAGLAGALFKASVKAAKPEGKRFRAVK